MSFVDGYTFGAAITFVVITSLLIWAMTAEVRFDRAEYKRMRADESKRRSSA